MFGNPLLFRLERSDRRRKCMMITFLLLALLWSILFAKSLVTDDVEMKHVLTSISILSLILVVLSSIYPHGLFLMLLYPLAPLVVPMIYLTFTAVPDRALFISILIHIPHVAYLIYCIKNKMLCRWQLIPLGTIAWLAYIRIISISIDKDTFLYIYSTETISTMVLFSGSIVTIFMIMLTMYTKKGGVLSEN